MSTPAAAVESAAPAAPVDPGTVSDGGGDIGVGSAPDFGTIADVREALGLGDDVGDTTEDKGAPAKDAKKPEAKVAAKKPEGEEEDPDAAAILAINKRSAAHRRARKEALAKATAPAVEAKPPEPAKPAEQPKAETKPEPTKLTAPESEAAKAAKEVLGLIAKLAGDDQEAAAAAEDPTAKQAAERQGVVDQIKAQLEGLTTAAKDAAKEEGKALQARVDAAEAQLKAIEDARVVREHIETKVDDIADELPTLLGRRDSAAVMQRAVNKFWDKYGKFPDVHELARRVEAGLAAKTANENTEKTEKRPQTRKTVSNSLGSPPAARTGPDTRTAAQAEADFNARWGIDT